MFGQIIGGLPILKIIGIKNNQWFIKNNPSRDPMINKVFLFAGAKCHGSSIKTYDDLDFGQLSQEQLMNTEI